MNTNNKIPATDSTLKNDNLSKVTKSYVFYVLIAGILTLLPVVELISELIATLAPNLELSNKIYAIAFYAVKVFGVLIYFFALKEKTIPKIIFALIAGIFLLLNGLAYSNLSNMESGGLDSLGQTLGYVMIYRICLYIYYAFTFTLFILHARNFLFKKKVLVSILIAITSAILLVFAYNIVSRFGATLEINTTSKTVNDFKNELLARNLYADENILLGINNKGEHLNLLEFDINSNEKYPSYIYYGYITKKDVTSSDENEEPLYWQIYYTNGKLYATMCEFYESSHPNSINISSNILCEENKLYIYNFEENHYDIIDDKNDGIFRADLPYRDDYTYITVEALTKTIYGYIEGLCIEYEVVDRIDNSTLDNYAVNFTLNKEE